MYAFIETPRERIRRLREEFPYVHICGVPSRSVLVNVKPTLSPYKVHEVEIPPFCFAVGITERHDNGIAFSFDCRIDNLGAMTNGQIIEGRVRGKSFFTVLYLVKGKEKIYVQNLQSTAANDKFSVDFYSLSDFYLMGI